MSPKNIFSFFSTFPNLFSASNKTRRNKCTSASPSLNYRQSLTIATVSVGWRWSDASSTWRKTFISDFQLLSTLPNKVITSSQTHHSYVNRMLKYTNVSRTWPKPRHLGTLIDGAKYKTRRRKTLNLDSPTIAKFTTAKYGTPLFQHRPFQHMQNGLCWNGLEKKQEKIPFQHM